MKKKRRNTAQRQIILHAVRARQDHPTADDIYLDVQADHPKISRGTVYRNLHLLAGSDELRQVKQHLPDRFDRRLDRHHHVRCVECGALADAQVDYQPELDEQIEAAHGYKIHSHSTFFEGICPDCQKRSES